MTNPREIRDTLNKLSLMETFISQSQVLNISITPYELSTLMKEFRAEKSTYNEIGNNAMAMFYSPEEKESFEKFLRSKGVKFSEIGDTTKDTGETSDVNTQSTLVSRKPNKYGV
jgi:uroporphyrinogen-III synthase